MKLLIINNLASGYGEGAIYDFIRAFTTDGDDVTIRSTDGTTHIQELLHDASDYDVVVASGGDGTIAATAYALANTGIPVLPFPAGTANLLAMNMFSPNEPHALAKMVREGHTLDFDLCEIEMASGEKLGFCMMAGAGYDATIMERAAPTKRLLGSMAYFTAALANPLPQVSKFTIEIDGETIESTGVGILLVNFSKIQFDISVVHENLPRDGAFDICVLKAHDAFGLLPALFAGILDRGGEFPDRTNAMEVHRGKKVTVTADPPLAMQHDGEPTELFTPFTVTMLPQAARYIVSEECISEYAED